jgi:hypothetical protein
LQPLQRTQHPSIARIQIQSVDHPGDFVATGAWWNDSRSPQTLVGPQVCARSRVGASGALLLFPAVALSCICSVSRLLWKLIRGHTHTMSQLWRRDTLARVCVIVSDGTSSHNHSAQPAALLSSHPRSLQGLPWRRKRREESVETRTSGEIDASTSRTHPHMHNCPLTQHAHSPPSCVCWPCA